MKSPWRATHCIVFTPELGPVRSWMVMARPTLGGRCAEGVTHGEWLSRTSPAWTCTPEAGWSWRGLPTPAGESGAVTVQELSGAYAIVSAGAEMRAG